MKSALFLSLLLLLFSICGLSSAQDWSKYDSGSPTVFDNDCSAYLQSLIDGNKLIEIPPGCYYFANPVKIRKPCSITMPTSWASSERHRANVVYRKDRTVFYTDQDINFFEIESGNVHIKGGCFDFSAVPSHSGAAFLYRPWHNDVTQPAVKENIRETNGSYDGSITDFWVVGNKDTLPRPGNGTRAIHLDWVNSPSYAYIYFHKWQGRCDRVRSGFSETQTNQAGKVGQNSTWNEIDLIVWGAKQGIVTNAQTRSVFQLYFQPQYGLHESETGLAVMELNSAGNRIDAKLVDMSIPDHPTLGKSNRYSVKTVQGNYFTETTLIEKHLLESAAVETGLAIQSPTSGLIRGDRAPDSSSLRIADLHNQLIGFDKRGSFSWAAYRRSGQDLKTIATTSQAAGIDTSMTAALAQPITLFRQSGFRSSIDFAVGSDLQNDYLELVLDWPPGLFQRFQLLSMVLSGSNTIPVGIRQYQVIQVNSSDAAFLNKTFDLPQSVGAFASIRDLQCKLDSSQQTKRLILRFIGSYSAGSYPIRSFAVFDDRNAQPAYLPITGGQLFGFLMLDDLWVKSGSTYKQIKPVEAGAPSTVQELTQKLKDSGIFK